MHFQFNLISIVVAGTFPFVFTVPPVYWFNSPPTYRSSIFSSSRPWYHTWITSAEVLGILLICCTFDSICLAFPRLFSSLLWGGSCACFDWTACIKQCQEFKVGLTAKKMKTLSWRPECLSTCVLHLLLVSLTLCSGINQNMIGSRKANACTKNPNEEN